MELLNTLGVNAGMLIAQAINFGILLAALTFLLYRPVLRVIDERRERVKKSMEDARLLEQRVADMEKDRKARMQEADKQMQEVLSQARKQAEQTKQEIIAGAQKEVEQMLEKGKQQLSEERSKLLQSVQTVVTNLTMKLGEKLLQREFKEADQQVILKNLEKDLPSLVR